MELLIKYLGTGRIEKEFRSPAVYLVVGNFSDLFEKIISFFKTIPYFRY